MPDTIRCRPDGSIDTAHYMALGRRCRSMTARDLVRALFGTPNSLRSWPARPDGRRPRAPKTGNPFSGPRGQAGAGGPCKAGGLALVPEP